MDLSVQSLADDESDNVRKAYCVHKQLQCSLLALSY